MCWRKRSPGLPRTLCVLAMTEKVFSLQHETQERSHVRTGTVYCPGNNSPRFARTASQ